MDLVDARVGVWSGGWCWDVKEMWIGMGMVYCGRVEGDLVVVYLKV